MSGLAALDAKCSSRLGIMTISYYLWTTFVAVVVGIVMVYIIHPGGAAQKEDSEDSKKPMTSSADALLDLIRWEMDEKLNEIWKNGIKCSCKTFEHLPWISRNLSQTLVLDQLLWLGDFFFSFFTKRAVSQGLDPSLIVNPGIPACQWATELS